MTLAVGRTLVGAGAAVVVVGFVVRRGWRQEVVGVGLAVIMTGLMVVLLGNYLRHADRAFREGEADGGAPPGDDGPDGAPDGPDGTGGRRG